MPQKKNNSGIIGLLFLIAFLLQTCSVFAQEESGANWSTLNQNLKAQLSRAADITPFVEHIGGFVQNRNYLRVHSLGPVEMQKAVNGKRVEDTYELRNDIRVDTDVKIQNWTTGRVSLDTQLDYGVNRDDFHPVEQTFKLFEGYGDFKWRQVDLRLGRQVIRWGKADAINPVDNFTPEDFKEFINLEREERKLPIFANYLKYYFKDNFKWEGIWAPFFNENLIAESEQDWEFFLRRNYRKKIGATFSPEKRPARRFKNSVWATRLVHEGTKADVSLSYAYHFEQNPSYKFHRDPLFPLGLSSSPGTVDTVWPREHSIGTDFEMAHNDFGFRGEGVLTTNKPYVTNDLNDDDFLVQKNTFETVLGGDYTYHSNTYFNVQYTQDFILDHQAAMEPHAYENSVTFRIWRKFNHEKLKLQFQGRYYLSDFDFYYKADATYELAEDLEINSGIMIFQGEEQDVFGQFAKNDQIFMRTKYTF